MLACQNFGWSHQCTLKTISSCKIQSRRRHRSFARTDIALNQSRHLLGLAHVGGNLEHGTALSAREGKRQHPFKLEHVLFQGAKLFAL